MYQRPRYLTEFDLRFSRVFIFLFGIAMILFADWKIRTGWVEAGATTWLMAILVTAGAWCIYAAVTNRVKVLESPDVVGSGEPLLVPAVMVLAILSFFVALILPSRTSADKSDEGEG